MSYLVFQVETAPETKKDHIQGYVHFKKKKAFKTVQALFTGAHLEAAAGTPAENKAYCTKEDTRKAGPWEFGEVPLPGKRRDLETAYDMLAAGSTDLDILSAVPCSFIRYPQGLTRARFVLGKAKSKEFRKVEVLVLWGETRVGKTRSAVERTPGAYLCHPSNPEWWDGYEGESALILDDYASQWPIHRLLQLLDGQQCRLPVKGTQTWAMWTNVVITSNTNPVMWYPNVNTQTRAALMARLTTILEVTPEMQYQPIHLTPSPKTTTIVGVSSLTVLAPRTRRTILQTINDDEKLEPIPSPGWPTIFPLDEFFLD